MAVKKIRLSNRRARWVGRRSVTLNGGTLEHNISAGERYAVCLTKAVREMTRAVKQEIHDLLETPEARDYFGMDASLTTRTRLMFANLTSRFEKSFKVLASDAAKTMVEGINSLSERSVGSSLKK